MNVHGRCEYCNHNLITDEHYGLVCSMECEADSQWPNIPEGWPNVEVIE